MLLVAYCDEEMAPAIKASPGLTRFSLNIRSTENMCVTEPYISFQRLLGNVVPNLVQLELENVPFPAKGLKQTLTCHLQNLSVSTLPYSPRSAFAWAELWSALKEINVKLSTLSVKADSECAVNEMLAYLHSYTGLRKLSVFMIDMERQDLEDDAGLWHQIVPYHRDSLTDLAVKTVSWVYSAGYHSELFIDPQRFDDYM